MQWFANNEKLFTISKLGLAFWNDCHGKKRVKFVPMCKRSSENLCCVGMLLNGVDGFRPFGFGPLTTCNGARGGETIRASGKKYCSINLPSSYNYESF